MLGMARQLHVEYEGAIYHVMSRGDRREEIFRDDVDQKRFLPILAAFGNDDQLEMDRATLRNGNTDQRLQPSSRVD